MAHIIKNPTNLLPEIRRALQLPPDDAVERKVLACMNILREHYPSLKDPEIRYDLKGHTAGMANASYIRINVDLLYTEHKDDMLNQTIPHEIAHVAQRQLFPCSKPHGREWAHFCYLLGIPAERCHNYETTAARKRSKMPRPFVYVCSCRKHYLTKILHKRILQGRYYKCRDCGQTLAFIGISVDDHL